MKTEDQAKIEAARKAIEQARETLQRGRAVRVRVSATWTRFDDLPPEDEAEVKAVLTAALDEWSARHGIELEIKGPEVDVRKMDYYAFGDPYP
jgi:hypothetical protein